MYVRLSKKPVTPRLLAATSPAVGSTGGKNQPSHFAWLNSLIDQCKEFASVTADQNLASERRRVQFRVAANLDTVQHGNGRLISDLAKALRSSVEQAGLTSLLTLDWLSFHVASNDGESSDSLLTLLMNGESKAAWRVLVTSDTKLLQMSSNTFGNDLGKFRVIKLLGPNEKPQVLESSTNPNVKVIQVESAR